MGSHSHSSSSRSHSSKPHKKSHYGSVSSSSSSYSASDSDLSSQISGSSDVRYSMDSGSRPVVSVEVLRCLRCARSVETTSTDDLNASGMVRIAHNLYYCERCAKMTGYK